MRKLLFVLLSAFVASGLSAQSIFETVLKPHTPYGSTPFELISDMAFEADSSLRIITYHSAEVPGNNSAIHYYNYYQPSDTAYLETYAGYWFGPDADFTQETFDPVKGNKVLLEADVHYSPMMISRHRFHEFLAPDSSRWFQKDRLPACVNAQEVKGKLMSVYHPYTTASNWVRQRSDTLKLAVIDFNLDSLIDQQNIYLPFVPQEVGVFFYQESDSLIKLTYSDTTFVYKLGNPNLLRTEVNSTFSHLFAWERFHALNSGKRIMSSNDTTREITLEYFDATENRFEVTLEYHGDSAVNYNGAFLMRQDSTFLAAYTDTSLRLNDSIDIHIFEYDKKGEILNHYDFDPDYNYMNIHSMVDAGNGIIYLGGGLYSVWQTNYTGFTEVPYFAAINLNSPISVEESVKVEVNFSIFPTLTNHLLKLQTDLKGPQEFEIYNTAGQTVLIGKVNPDAVINVEPLSAGLYHFRLKGQAGQIPFMKY